MNATHGTQPRSDGSVTANTERGNGTALLDACVDGVDVACDRSTVYPVYVRAAVVSTFLAYSRQQAPAEAIGLLFGFRRQWQGIPYTQVAHWEPGTAANTSAASGRLDAGEIRAIRNRVDEYSQDAGKLVGVCHSHPFGGPLDLSCVDRDTFLSFPYNLPGNVFLLADPTVPDVRWYRIRHGADGGPRKLDLTSWVLVGHPEETAGHMAETKTLNAEC